MQLIAARYKQPSMPLSIDAVKAFQQADWVFLRHTMIEMGFGEKKIVVWISLFYKEPCSKVRVNGCCSNFFFKVERVVRQGDSLSPVLFALTIEPLAETI